MIDIICSSIPAQPRNEDWRQAGLTSNSIGDSAANSGTGSNTVIYDSDFSVADYGDIDKVYNI